MSNLYNISLDILNRFYHDNFMVKMPSLIILYLTQAVKVKYFAHSLYVLV